MFIRQEPLILVARAPAFLDRARAARTAFSLAALSLLSSSCALQVHEGDGLVSDGREILVSASTVPDAGKAAVSPVDVVPVLCKQVPLYQQRVVPLFYKKFSSSTEVDPKACVDCHDGSKGKASAALLMFKDMAMEGTESMCSLTLTLGATKPDKQQSEILLSSDPSRPDVEHDFKFKTMDEYVRFRDEVLIWLAAEKDS